MIRPANPEDLPSLREIYNHYVRVSACTFDVAPKDERQMRAWFDRFTTDGPHRLWVAEEDERVVGYVSSGSFRSKAAYRTSVELSVYLAPDARGRRVGAKLTARSLHALSRERVHRALAGIAMPNLASERLFRGLGFRHVGTFREVGFKFGKWWDVAWFEKQVTI